MIYTFTVPVVLTFDVVAEGEEDALRQAYELTSKDMEGAEVLDLYSPYLRVAKQTPTLEEIYDSETDAHSHPSAAQTEFSEVTAP
jgi:hypothetical protein